MPPASWAFCAAGADDEITANENIAAWRALRLRPRVLNDVGNVDTAHEPARRSRCRRRSWWRRPAATNCSTRKASGRPRAAPRWRTRLCDGDRIPTSPIEEVAAERKTAPQWFQLYYWPNRAEVEALIDRLAAAGFSALVLTVDAPVPGWSPRAAREQHAPSPEIRNINMPGAADGAHRLSSRLRRQGDVSGDLARTGMAGEALADAGDGQGRAARRRCRSLRRVRRARRHRLQPRRPPSRHAR